MGKLSHLMFLCYFYTRSCNVCLCREIYLKYVYIERILTLVTPIVFKSFGSEEPYRDYEVKKRGI